MGRANNDRLFICPKLGCAFPTLIALISMFFAGGIALSLGSIGSAFLLTCILVLGVISTLVASSLLSKTVLKGVSSSFTLEMPPYRRPQVCKVIVRSIFDRTLHVLGRAVIVAAPAGIIIWIFANVDAGGTSLLSHFSNFLDPFARIMGLDGIILMAFIFGLPANEIVVPLIIMGYLSSGSIFEFETTAQLHELLVNNGWTWKTAICVVIFTVMHWPCSTTLLTIKKETKSLKYMLISAALPTLFGIILCIIFNLFLTMLKFC